MSTQAGLPLQLGWGQIALRLALTVLISLLVGFNRSEHGKRAGMVTTMLVSLAASLAMIQVNLLLPMAGRVAASFVMNDLMRLPLGILTGVGFIGAGAILRHGSDVAGVTTAATLWLMTVVGLCLGGGQWILGLLGGALALAALSVLKRLENAVSREYHGRLGLDLAEDAPTESEILKRLKSAGLRPTGSEAMLYPGTGRRRLALEVRLMRRLDDPQVPRIVEELGRCPGVRRLRWRSSL